MPREIVPDVYLIEVPLPDNPLKNLNSYYIRGKERSLLIDTGFNHDVCYDALMGGLEELGTDLDLTDIFVTHLHADHSGLCGRIAHHNTRIFIGAADFPILRNAQNGDSMKMDQLLTLGFSEEEFFENQMFNPSIIYKSEKLDRAISVEDGKVFSVGDYVLRAIHTPGHTPGHMCLYDEKHELLFSGDHVIFGITPNISTWPDMPDSLGSYLESLQKIQTLNVKTTLSAHRNPIGDLHSRIDTLIEHHRMRLLEVEDILETSSGSSCYEIASEMKWKVHSSSWSEFPISQKWFAASEAAAHLDYLIKKKRVFKEFNNGTFQYYSNDSHQIDTKVSLRSLWNGTP